MVQLAVDLWFDVGTIRLEFRPRGPKVDGPLPETKFFVGEFAPSISTFA